MIRSEPTFAKLLADMRAAVDLLSRQQYAEAKKCLIDVRGRADALGIRSVSLLCNLAEANAELGEIEAAFRFVSEAAALDPLDPAVQTAFNKVCNGLRALLTERETNAAAEATARIYATLSKAGETDVPCHLAMARHLHVTGHTPEALKLLKAVSLVAPASLDTWKLMAEFARALGDTILAAACEEKLASRVAQPPPFGIPTLS